MQLIELKVLPPISSMLGVQDPKTVTVALDGIHNILSNAAKVSLNQQGRCQGRALGTRAPQMEIEKRKMSR